MKYVHCLKGTSKKREQRIWKHTCRGMAGEKGGGMMIYWYDGNGTDGRWQQM